MIKSFSLFTEAYDIKYDNPKWKIWNNFSRGHRNLPGSCIMYDIDKLLLSSRDKAVAIIEAKGTYDSKVLGNPLDVDNRQRNSLYSVCTKIDLVLLLLETSTKRIYKVLDDRSIKVDYETVFGFGKTLKTDDLLYIEFRSYQPISIMYRTDGVKENDLNNVDTYKVSVQLSERLNIPMYLVDDQIPGDIIYIKKKDYSTEMTYGINYKSADSWVDIYRKLGLYR